LIAGGSDYGTARDFFLGNPTAPSYTSSQRKLLAFYAY
jgi:hypothetical protein